MNMILNCFTNSDYLKNAINRHIKFINYVAIIIFTPLTIKITTKENRQYISSQLLYITNTIRDYPLQAIDNNSVLLSV